MMNSLGFKNPKRLLSEWAACQPILRDIVFWMLENVWPAGTLALVSCIWRNHEENEAAGAKTAVHCARPHRAIDFSLRGIDSAAADHLAGAINEYWAYDPTRPTKVVAYVHDAGSGVHLHLQCHTNTAVRNQQTTV